MMIFSSYTLLMPSSLSLMHTTSSSALMTSLGFFYCTMSVLFFQSYDSASSCNDNFSTLSSGTSNRL